MFIVLNWLPLLSDHGRVVLVALIYPLSDADQGEGIAEHVRLNSLQPEFSSTWPSVNRKLTGAGVEPRRT